MRKLIALSVMSAVLAGLAVNASLAEDKEEKKEKEPMSLHDIMNKGFKGSKSLLSKVKNKKKDATQEEKEEFLVMIKDMARTKPPKGDQKSWDKFTKALLVPTEMIVKGEDVEKSKSALAKAAVCGKCHKVHQPKKERK